MSPDAILEFWFGSKDDPRYRGPRQVWFRKDERFDSECRQRFAAAWRDGLEGRYDAWMETAEGSLALCVLFDQFPRNMFRGTAQMFASDAKAREVARAAIARCFDQAVPPVHRWFLYLPLEHSESIEDQHESLRRFGTLSGTESGEMVLRYAQQHHDIVARYGRFPHRNALLGRESTAEEREFLSQPGSSF